MQKHYIPSQPPQRQPPRTSAILSDRQFEESRPIVVMAAGLLLIIFSLILSSVSFHGGDWRAAFTAPSPARWALALAVQLYCTAMEWYNRRRKASAWYWTALILDIVSSVGGLLAPTRLLVYVFVGMLFPQAYTALMMTPLGPITRLIAAEWAIALLFAYGVARIPEDKLIAE